MDDGSKDGTREFLRSLTDHSNLTKKTGSPAAFGRLSKTDNIRVFFQEVNCGKGAALRRGFQEARVRSVVIQDADLELDPQEYPRLIAPIERGEADVVYGSRFLGKSREGQPLAYYMANHIDGDLEPIHRAEADRCVDWVQDVPPRSSAKIDLRENRFSFEPEVTAKIAKCGCRVSEVAVSYTCRARGKKIGWKDSVRGMWCTIRYSLLPDKP